MHNGMIRIQIGWMAWTVDIIIITIVVTWIHEVLVFQGLFGYSFHQWQRSRKARGIASGIQNFR